MNEQWTGTAIKALWLHFFVLFLLSIVVRQPEGDAAFG